MKFGIIGNTEKAGLLDAVQLLLRKLDQSNTPYVVDENIARELEGSGSAVPMQSCASMEECATRSDMVIAFGGDGTMLVAARIVGKKGTPILGVNLGKLGFLAEFSVEEIERAIQNIVNEQFVIEERLVLAAEATTAPGVNYYALNDFVVDKSRSSRMIDVDMYINGAFAVNYQGDGLIVSTPTGSTAYALSCGGPIVTPTSGVIGITPISPHTLNGRPLIIPEDSEIRLVVFEGNEEVLFSSDGQTEIITRPPFELTIKSAAHRVKLVKRVDRSYYDVLRAKLFWGRDPRSLQTKN